MSARAMAWAWSQISQGRVPGGPGTALVLLKLADRADPEGRCWPGHERTAADLGLSPSTVRASTSKLDAAGLLEVHRRQVEGRDASNLYHLHIDAAPKEISDRVPDFGTRAPIQSQNRVPKFGTESKTGTSHKQRTAAGGAPVDNQDPEPQGTPGQELEAIRDALGLSSSQLGNLAAICKSNNCRLQDVHRVLTPHIQAKGLRGQQAFLYFKKCLAQNPGRDWTYEARRDAQRQAQAEQATQADVARQRFLDRLAKAGSAGLPVSNGGRIFNAPPQENPEVFLTYQKPDGTSFLSRITDFLNAFPEFLKD